MKVDKLIFGIIVLIVVIGLPFGSWKYLSDGLEYRKALGKEVVIKGQFNTTSDFQTLQNIHPDIENIFSGATTLLVNSSKEISDQLSEMIDQFKHSGDFKLISFAKDFQKLQKHKEYLFLKTDQSQGINHTFYLIDNEGNLRATYDNEDAKVLNKMVEHLAIIVKKAPTKDIIQKPTEK